ILSPLTCVASLTDIAASRNSPSGSGTVLSTRMILSRTFVPTGSRCALVSCARDEAVAIAIAAKSPTATVFLMRTSRIAILYAIRIASRRRGGECRATRQQHLSALAAKDAPVRELQH